MPDRPYSSTVVLAGVGRSGTTWVADIINHAGEYRVIWEPFHRYRVPELACFEYHQYLRPDDHRDAFCEGAHAVITGKVENSWVNSHGHQRGSSRLIKDIRANLLLGWIRERFPGVSIVLLMRHPCAVSASWTKLGWGWEDGGERTVLDACLSQHDLVEDYLRDFLPHIREARTPLERHVFLWCVLNYVPLCQFHPGEIHLAFYERFCTQPDQELNRLFGFLGRTHDDRVHQILKTPSALARERSAICTGGDLLDSWRADLAQPDADRTVEILRLFGLDSVYGESSEPLVQDPDRLLESFVERSP